MNSDIKLEKVILNVAKILKKHRLNFKSIYVYWGMQREEFDIIFNDHPSLNRFESMHVIQENGQIDGIPWHLQITRDIAIEDFDRNKSQ